MQATLVFRTSLDTSSAMEAGAVLLESLGYRRDPHQDGTIHLTRGGKGGSVYALTMKWWPSHVALSAAEGAVRAQYKIAIIGQAILRYESAVWGREFKLLKQAVKGEPADRREFEKAEENTKQWTLMLGVLCIVLGIGTFIAAKASGMGLERYALAILASAVPMLAVRDWRGLKKVALSYSEA